jgi:MFS family permease
MIFSSSLGYFFFSGLQAFALLFIKGHYHVGQATAELVLGVLVGGAMVGTLVSGKLTDDLVRRGSLNSRVWIPALCYIGASLLLIPAFVANKLTPSLWLAAVGAALLMAANPPLDAARLDIMPAGLWGRAESVRTFVRSLAQALAPLIFGGLAGLIAGFYPSQAPIGTHPAPPNQNEAHGLEITFLLLLLTLTASGLSLLRARHTYATDVATAAASNQGSSEPAVTPRTNGSRTSRADPSLPAVQRSNRPQQE